MKIHKASSNQWGMTHEVIRTGNDGGPESAGMFPSEEDARRYVSQPALADALREIIRTYDQYLSFPELSGKVEPGDIAVARKALADAGLEQDKVTCRHGWSGGCAEDGREDY